VVARGCLTGEAPTRYSRTVARSRSEQYDIARRSERMADQDVPLSTEAGHTLFAKFDTRFTRGLRAIVDGVSGWAGHTNVGTSANANKP
jgi:hypothetical protein